MKTRHLLVVGDARSALRELSSQSVQLVVTSPPYWNIKNYAHPLQIGFRQGYDQYIDALTEVWSGCKLALSPGCKMVINIGDQFLRARDNGRYEVKAIHTDIIRSCLKLGFIFLGNIIWQKITTTKTTGGGAWMGSIYYPRDGYVTYEHEYIMIFKKPGKAPKPTPIMKANSRLPKEFRSRWFRGVWADVPPVRQRGHLAMFPLELPERIIRMFTFAEETVLDPFVGSGTTMEAAERWGRNSVGIEVNRAYVPLVRKRVPEVSLHRVRPRTRAAEERKVS
jgi:DNA modification methylase